MLYTDYRSQKKSVPLLKRFAICSSSFHAKAPPPTTFSLYYLRSHNHTQIFVWYFASHFLCLQCLALRYALDCILAWIAMSA